MHIESEDDVKNRTWHYVLDTEGHLWHEGAEFEDPELLRFFMRKLKRLPDGRLQVICQGETCYIDAEDVPYVVLAMESKPDGIELVFPGNYREMLDPSTLSVGKDNVLYCKVRGGEFDARFSRHPYMELAKQVDEDEQGRFYLELGNQRYPIAGIVDHARLAH